MDIAVGRSEHIIHFDVLSAERLDVLHERPPILRLKDIVTERRHGRARQSTVNTQIEIAPRGATAKGARVEVTRWERNAPIVFQRRSGRSIACACFTVTSEA